MALANFFSQVYMQVTMIISRLRDLNAILNDSEKQGGRRKSRVQMDEFRMMLANMVYLMFKPASYGGRRKSRVQMDEFRMMLANNGWVKLSSWQKDCLATSRGRIQVLRNKINSSFSRHTSEAELQNLKRDKEELNILLNKEEVYWMQRSRVQWLANGDRNTSYLHARANGRHKKNYIRGLMDKNGIWKEVLSDDSVIDAIDTVITDEMNGALCADFTTDEIIAAFRDIHPLKAPGIDGILTSFYRLHWDIVGADVIKGAAIKLDMEKAYDRVEWSFLIKVMLKLGFCIDWGLSALFNRLQAQRKIHGMGASRNGPKNSLHEASIIRDALGAYEAASGQKVNLEKSTLYFSPSTRQECRDQISSILGIGEVPDLGHYLGMPLHIGKNKRNTFGYLKEKDLVSNRHYWWSGDANRRGWPMVAWKTMCKPKREGGMGFWDLHSFNLALLGKQLWRFIKDPERLVARVFRSKYFSHGDMLLHATLKDRSPYAWKGLYHTLQEMCGALFWCIGIRSNKRVHHDIWGGSKVVSLTRSYSNSDLNPLYCSDLMIDGSNVWNESLIYRLFSKEDAMQILSVPIAPCAEDVIVWANHDSGIYSVISGYWWLQKRHHDNERKSKLWSVMVATGVALGD
ncbi:uncharacterized protein LOC120212775 [Hibiscus syriacus]|uniref:uncharacterized protein LOC120212775 n=1 Tax=Hibiscus syriacus TaxID=106335 RepID=UPI0019237EA5|nr:uncharacterized protein LOC120212775 [Hibiscus syriacus]